MRTNKKGEAAIYAKNTWGVDCGNDDGALVRTEGR